MPFIRGELCKRKKLVGVANDMEVFVTPHSHEAFTKFSDFSMEVQKYLSSEWICSVCGKCNLTYEEAEKCEKEAELILCLIQPEFGVPLLYLASKTECYELSDMVHTVHNYVKDRYFLGEIVEINYRGAWHPGQVCEILKDYDNEERALERSGDHYPANVFWYAVNLANYGNEMKLVVLATAIRRDKQPFTEELLLKYLALFAQKSQKGIWKIKKYILNKYGIHQFSFSNAFYGLPPAFQKTERLQNKSVVGRKKISTPLRDSASHMELVDKGVQNALNGYVDHSVCSKPKKGIEALNENISPVKEANNKSILAKKKTDKCKVVSNKLHKQRTRQTCKARGHGRDPTRDKKKTNRKERPAEIQHEKKKKVILKLKRKEQLPKREKVGRGNQKQKKPQITSMRKRSTKKCKDLKCEDLFIQIQCKVANEFFGDFMIVLEFLHSFKDVLPMMDTIFPTGITFEMVERALIVKEVGGPFCDILQLFLLAVFTLQNKENEELHEARLQPLNQFMRETNGGDECDRAVRLAISRKYYSQLSFGVPVKDLPLDAFSISEVLRLHLLMSGGLCKKKQAKWRLQYRGGYRERDDPGLLFCIEESKLLDEMAYKSVSELPIENKLKLVICLIHQILTYVSVREMLDKRTERVNQVKQELRLELNKLRRKMKECPAAKFKKTKENELKRYKNTSDPLSYEEIQAQLLKIKKEILRKQQEANTKAKELCDIAMSFQVLPLGTDHACRRYWMFSSLPGLFIEQDGKGTGAPLPKIPSWKSVSSSKDTVIQQVNRHSINNSTKENHKGDAYEYHSSSLKSMLVERSRCLSSERLKKKMDNCNQLHCESPTMASKKFITRGNPLNVPVWYFCGKEEDFLSLLEHLSRRNQEAQLYQSLMKEKDIILKSIQSCRTNELNPSCVSDTPEVRRSARKKPTCNKQWNNCGYPSGTPLPEIWYELLRNEILDIEDRLYRGGLGFLQVNNRVVWRETLFNKGYDKQCEHLAFNFKVKSENQEEQNYEKPDPYMLNTEFLDIISTPYHFTQNDLSEPIVMKVLACAILQVKQCILKRYLKGTFITLPRWEMSLMKCTSFSQLYLHLIILNNNICWSKSALKAWCRLCRSRGDAENMLLCDGCNKGYHTYCLKPKVRAIPNGDWYCPPCQWKDEPISPEKEPSEESYVRRYKKRKILDRCDICGLEGMLSSCVTCCRAFHVECHFPSSMKKTKNKQCKVCYLEEKMNIRKRSH